MFYIEWTVKFPLYLDCDDEEEARAAALRFMEEELMPLLPGGAFCGAGELHMCVDDGEECRDCVRRGGGYGEV